MTNLLLGIGPINSALRLARGVLGAITGAGRSGASFAEVQRQAMVRRERETSGSAANGSVPASAIGSPGAAGAASVSPAAAVRSYEKVLRSQAEGLMKRLDSDGDELLAAAELGVSTAEFERIDADGNGEVDIVELARAMEAGRIPAWKA